MTWPQIPFEQLFFEPQRNGIYKPKPFHGSGIKIVNMGDLFAFRFVGRQEMKRLELESDELCRFGLANGDLLFARRSLIESGAGKCVIVEGLSEPAVFESSLIRVRLDPKNCDSRFYYYYFQDRPGRSAVEAIITGAAQKGIRGSELAEIEIHQPPLPIQRKIAGILSAYDDLIENNTRRIAILEEMAQAIYREWFAEFRFPGHEKVKLVKSPLGMIPEGWKVATLEEACDSVVDGDWIETKDQGGEDYRLLQVSNIGTGCFVETGNYRYVTRETFDRLRCQEVKPGQILISRMPKPIGRAWLVTEMPWRMITAVDVAIATAHPDRSTAHFLVAYLNSPDHIDNAEKHATGTTRPRVSRSALSGLRFVLPPITMQQSYTDAVADGYSLITALRKKNDVLSTTRDLLLPKLISGQLDVENIDIDTGEAVTE